MLGITKTTGPWPPVLGAHYVGNAPAVGHYPTLSPPDMSNLDPILHPVYLLTYLRLSVLCFEADLCHSN
jgi:hypothetical protein